MQQSKEKSTNAEEGVVIPEEFQQKVHHLIKDATKHHLTHIRDRVYAREDELRKEEEAKKNSGKKPNAKIEFTTEGGPVEPATR